MRFWFSRSSQVPVRQQLVTQVMLGILCNDLAPGERLPSTREIARRFHLHPNTVSAAYRQLGQEGWVEFRHGSGVYVCETKSSNRAAPTPEQLIADLVLASRQAGLSLQQLRRHLRHWIDQQPPHCFVLVEPDQELRRIVVAELSTTRLPISSCGFTELAVQDLHESVFLVLPSKAARLREQLGPGPEVVVLQVRSAPASLAEWMPLPRYALIAIASRWTGFLEIARTMLIAAGFDAEALVVRDAGAAGWQQDLACVSGIVCDALTARSLPPGVRSAVFPIVADASLEELSRWEEFIGTPEKLSQLPRKSIAARP